MIFSCYVIFFFFKENPYQPNRAWSDAKELLFMLLLLLLFLLLLLCCCCCCSRIPELVSVYKALDDLPCIVDRSYRNLILCDVFSVSTSKPSLS